MITGHGLHPMLLAPGMHNKRGGGGRGGLVHKNPAFLGAQRNCPPKN